MSGYHELVASAVEATSVHSPTAYSWFGRRFDDLPEGVKRAMAPETARSYLLYALQMQLYNDFYCQGAPTPARDWVGQPPMPHLSPFGHTLSAANTGDGTREPGWSVRALEEGKVVVERDGLRLWLSPADAFAPADVQLAPGASVSVGFPKELLQLSPGFYMALGREWLEVDPSQRVVRFYWNLRSEGAPLLLGGATTRLNAAGLAFRLKVVNEPDRYTRCDAGVLYVRRDDYAEVARIVAEAYLDVKELLEPATPAFSKRLAPGLGLAEEPGAGDSFGTNRCLLVADGIIRAHERGRHSLDERLHEVEARFEEDGVRLAAPYLNPGSTDHYDFPNL